jgi:hypothetical protein
MDAAGTKIEMKFLDLSTNLPITNTPFNYDDLELEELATGS